jgi:uncharacterized membrane protein
VKDAGDITSAHVRIQSVDLLRGVIMAIMMLDHTRDFVLADLFDPTDITRTYPALFFTRWVTHFCAPVFVFLAGTGVYFQEMRGKTKRELSWFLVTRGLWFVGLELVVFRPLIFFNANYAGLLAYLQVIWAIGWSMIVLAVVIHLPLRAIAAMSLVMIALHNTLDRVHATGPLWHILHERGEIFPFGYPGPAVDVLYPLIPWIGVMWAGYAFGSLYRKPDTARRRALLWLGAAFTLAFVLLRIANIYGDPIRWSTQPTATKTVLSFLALSKYPPSLLFLMMTLGPALLFLVCVDRPTDSRLVKPLIVYGKVPMFFYVLQWATTHTLAIVAYKLAGKPTDSLFADDFTVPAPAAGIGFGLLMVYVLWILGLVLLYPLCRWFADVKARRRDWWLGYL